MQDSTDYYLLATAVAAALVALYWLQPERRKSVAGKSRALTGLFVLIATGIGLCLWSVFSQDLRLGKVAQSVL